MKQIIFFFSILFIVSCANETKDAPKDISKGTSVKKEAGIVGSNGKLYTSFDKNDVVNKMLGDNISNATQSQVDLRNLVRNIDPFTLQPLISVNQLKSVFPEKIGSLERVSFNGEINSIFGSPATLAKANYRLGDNVARVSFVDSGNSPETIVKIANWAGRVINKEEAEYYEHTKTFGGYPAYERVIKKSNANNFDFIVDNRWVFSIQSINIPIDQIHNFAGSLNTDRLRSSVKK